MDGFNNLPSHLSYSVENTIQRYSSRSLKNPFLPVAETADTYFSGERAVCQTSPFFFFLREAMKLFKGMLIIIFWKTPLECPAPLVRLRRETKHLIPSSAQERASLSVPLHSVHNATKNQHLRAFPVLNGFQVNAEQNGGHFCLAGNEESQDNSMPSSVH